MVPGRAGSHSSKCPVRLCDRQSSIRQNSLQIALRRKQGSDDNESLGTRRASAAIPNKRSGIIEDNAAGVRQRCNVLKDTRDTSFILWVVVEGLAIGTSRFSVAVLAAVGIGVAFLLLRFMSFGVRNRYDAVLSLRVTGDVVAQLGTLRSVLKRHATRLDLASERRATNEGTDITYRLLLRDTSRSSELQAELSKTEGFQNISVYMHEDEAEI